MAQTSKQSRTANKKSKSEEATSDAQSMNIGMRFALIYFAILVGMTFVFLAAPPAHSATAEISFEIQASK